MQNQTNPNRRRHGSVYRRKDGRWVAALTVRYNENGNPDRVQVYEHTVKDARKSLKVLIDICHEAERKAIGREPGF